MSGGARYALPPGDATIRCLRLPTGPRRVRREALQFELARLFPPEERATFRLVHAAFASAALTDVVVAAARAQDLRDRLTHLAAHGADVAAIRPAAEAVVHFMRWLQPREPRPGIVVDVRAHAVQVLLVHGTRWSVRTFPDATGTSPVVAAERIHLEVARLVSTWGQPIEPAWIRLCGRPLDPAVSLELARLFRLAPASVWLPEPKSSGLTYVHLPMSVLVEARPVLIGLALLPPTEGLNLLRWSERRPRWRTRIRRTMTMGFAALAVALGVWSVELRAASREEATRAADLAAAERRVQALQQAVAAAEEAVAESRAQVEALRMWRAGRDEWPRLLADLQQSLQEAGAAWVERLETVADDAGGPLRLRVVGQLWRASTPDLAIDETTRVQVDRLLTGARAAQAVVGVEQERFESAKTGQLGFEFLLRLRGPTSERTSDPLP